MRFTITPDPGEHLDHADPAEIAKSLTRQMRAAGVGNAPVEGGRESPWPALEERLETVRRAVEEQRGRMMGDLERLYLNREA